MARDETPPFSRGRTFYNGETIETNNLGGVNYEGKEYKHEDTVNGTGAYVTLRVVRNVSGISLYSKRLVRFKSGYYGQRVDGYTTTTNEAGYPIDDAYVPSFPIVNNDLFYIVVDGPVKVKNGTTVATTTVIAETNPLSALTAAASTGASTTDTGRVRVADTSGATTPLATGVLNVVGRAMSAAATSGVTDTDILVWVTKSF